MIKIFSNNNNNYCIYCVLLIVLMDRNLYCDGKNSSDVVTATASMIPNNSHSKFYKKYRRKSIEINNNYPFVWTDSNCDDNQQQPHFSWKTYKSDIVLLVKAQLINRHSRPRDKRRNKKRSVTVQFVKLSVLKYNAGNSVFIPRSNIIMLNFISRKMARVNNCSRSRNIINAIANIKINEEYLLFLQVYSSDPFHARYYQTNWSPEYVGRKEKYGIMKIVRKICDKNFKSSDANGIIKLMEKSRTKSRLKLVCKFNGLPIYRIYWKRNNVTLTSNQRNVHIKYVNTWSTLTITDSKQIDSNSRYECIVQSPNGSINGKTIDIKTSQLPRYENPYSKEPCAGEHRRNLCLNNGTCFMDINPQNYYCECSDGFVGQRCEMKVSSHIDTSTSNSITNESLTANHSLLDACGFRGITKYC